MGKAVSLRGDYTAEDLRRLARSSRDADQSRRLLALASIYDGGSRSAAARIGSVTLQIVRDWVVRFNAEGPSGLVNRKASGPQPRLTAAQVAALAAVVEAGPTPALHGLVRWRLCDLQAWLWSEYRVSLSVGRLSCLLREMGYRKLSARPRHHAQDIEAAAAFKKTSPPRWRQSGKPSRKAQR